MAGLEITGMTPDDIAREAIAIFPQELVANIRHIVYNHDARPTLTLTSPDQPERAGGSFYGGTLSINSPNEIGKSPLGKLKGTLAHEIGHSNDLRLASWPGVSLEDQLAAVEEWEEIRGREETFSDYARLYKSRTSDFREGTLQRATAETVASSEDFAETFYYYVIYPEYLKSQAPLRFVFSEKWFRKRFPNVDEMIAKLRKTEKEYDALISYIAPEKPEQYPEYDYEEKK